MPAPLAPKSTEEERCGKCGKLMFKAYSARGFIFIELKCVGCNKMVIRKFIAYEKSDRGPVAAGVLDAHLNGGNGNG